MLTHFLQSINWVDVALAVLLARVIFVSVVNGFVTEVFKFFSVLCALFVSLHFYARVAAWIGSKAMLTVESWQLLVFLLLWAVIMVALKFAREGFLLLFKMEATHAGIDKYAAGLIGCGRAVLVCSLTVFALLLVRQPFIHNQAHASWGNKIIGKAAPNTYSFLYHHVIGKLFDREPFNGEVFAVVNSGHGTHSK